MKYTNSDLQSSTIHKTVNTIFISKVKLTFDSDVTVNKFTVGQGSSVCVFFVFFFHITIKCRYQKKISETNDYLTTNVFGELTSVHSTENPVFL